jgi:NADH:ubiquinone oxidoreductase subunit F (NADH-binding)
MDEPRLLDPSPVRTLDDYRAAGGGDGLAAARKVDREAVIDAVDASGLRGRGGAGFPTATKWRTVIANAAALPPTVVVNGAEGEPGSFKDRALLRRNPYRVLEGALIAAIAIGADKVLVALRRSFTTETERLEAALTEFGSEGWFEHIAVELVHGPEEYLVGEETALLEVLDGRAPFPRIAPPFRHGVDEVGDGTTSPADVTMAAGVTVAPPTLVNNVETLANVPGIVLHGPEWFRSIGTQDSPGSIVCTVSGSTRTHGVGEFAMGTPLSEIIERVGEGAAEGLQIVAAMSGVANPLLPARLLGTPVTYEDMERAGSGLGAAGFITFDDSVDLAAVASGVSRFLAVESCGQCTPCKQDGLAIAGLLDKVCRSDATENDLVEIAERTRTVSDEARCFLAHQHERVMTSVLQQFPEHLNRHVDEATPAVEPVLIAPIVDIVDGRAVLDEKAGHKQPDWSYDDEDSGKSPADLLDQGASAG